MNICKTVVPLLLFATSFASCQVATHGEAGAGAGGDLFVGAVFNSNNPANGTAGVGGGVSFPIFRRIGVVGEFDSYFGTPGVANNTTLFDFLVGPRISWSRNARISPFADVLVGGQYLHNGSTQHSYYYSNGGGAAFAGDGGIDIKLARHLGIRAQAGVIHSSFSTPPTTTSNNSFRAASFLVFRF